MIDLFWNADGSVHLYVDDQTASTLQGMICRSRPRGVVTEQLRDGTTLHLTVTSASSPPDQPHEAVAP